MPPPDSPPPTPSESAGDGPMDLERARRVAVDAAEAAGELLHGDPGWTQAKGTGGGGGTDLDPASEKLILGRPQQAFPGDQIVAPESRGSEAGGDRGWVVDPPDCTNNLAIRLPVCA